MLATTVSLFVDQVQEDARLAPAPRWKAIDADVEARLDVVHGRRPTWREMLFRWLYEYNRY